MPNTYSLLFIDDHPIYRNGVVYALRDRMPDVAIHDVASLEAACEVLGREDIDLVLADYRLEVGDGIDALREIRARHPSIACGIISGEMSGQLSRLARDIGVVALLSKKRDVEALIDAVQSVIAGACVFDDQALTANGSIPLTERRLEILRLAALGQSNKEIARRLDVSERTIKDHWSHILSRLEVSNRTQAVGAALRQGLIRISD